ncbi:polyamine ABC transporter substrate-binding protein [Vibrio furnissii]|uniref:polyamine ABC transporter substrate-binding protein n=1 Tax=Vibrio furnissii TaxID=29494 RepID=UPI003D7DE191
MTKSIFTALLGGCALTASVQSSELNLYLWEDTLSPRVVDAWHQRHPDTPLNLYHFDNDDERSLLMLKSVQLPFDVVVLDNVSAHIFSRQDLFEDLSHLPNRDNNAAKWNQACGSHAVPYFWGYVGIAYRKSKLAEPPTDWSQLVHIAPNMRGHVGLISDSVETLLPTLYSLGVSPITDSIDVLKQAYLALEQSNPNILTYEYALSYVRSHAENDNLYMALAYSGDQYSLNRFFANDDWSFSLPQGQPYLWVDCMAINSHSLYKPEAKAFLEFLMQPEITAMNAADIRGATPNLRAMHLLPPEYRNDATLFPAPDLVEQGIIDSELSPGNLNVRAKIINSVINQHEAQP